MKPLARWRWAVLALAVVSGLVCVLSALSDEPWTTSDIIGTVIYGLICVGGIIVFKVSKMMVRNRIDQQKQGTGR